jgi:hypothetical protein
VEDQEGRGVSEGDFTAIVEVWDKYAIDSPNMGLSTMKEYATRWKTSTKSKKKKHSSEDILRLKREYMLSTWRDREKEKRARDARRAQKGKEVERHVTTAGSPSHGDAAVYHGDEPSPGSYMGRDTMSDGPNITLDEDSVGEPSEPSEPNEPSRELTQRETQSERQ